MPARPSLAEAGGALAPSFQDRAFEPRSSFDFDEDMRHPDNNMASYGNIGDFDLVDGM